MALIHQNLYKQENLTGIDVKTYFTTLVNELLDSYDIDRENITVELNVESIELDVDTMIPLGLILNELVTNSLKYAFPDGKAGKLTIEFREEDGLHLTVQDDGVGMKNDDLEKADSFGSRLIRAFLSKMSGTIDYSFVDGTQVDIIINDYKTAA